MMDLDDRLANWGRAMRSGQRRLTCGSIEGSYRSPQRNHWQIVPSAPQPTVDAADARIVESAWASLDLLRRIILRGHYCDRWIPERICRVGTRLTRRTVRAHDYRLHLEDARCGIAQALVRHPDHNRSIMRKRAKQVLDMPEWLSLRCA